ALAATADELRNQLKLEGYQPGQSGCNKALQEILKRVAACNPGIALPHTPASGNYQTTEDALAPLADREPFVRSLLNFKQVEKLRSTFVSRLGKSVLHPSFNPLVKSGRTSSFGEINAQNLPRDEGIRHCFIAPPGQVFI